MNTNSIIVLCLVLFGFILLACTKNYDSEIYTFQGVFENKEDLIGKEIKIRALVKTGLPVCTLNVCTKENPCCNDCSAVLYLVKDNSFRDSETNAHINMGKTCHGTNCNLICDITPDFEYLMSGRFIKVNEGMDYSFVIANYTGLERR